MKYELALELEENDFPYSEKYSEARKTFAYIGDTGVGGSVKNARVPFLKELIEACGDGKFLLEKAFGTSPSGLDVDEYWVAQRGMYKETGTTPEEAVARLWLSLNKK